MIANIEHANGKMTCTTARGESATRKTDNKYSAAIVGRNPEGKLIICFASYSESKAREALATIHAGGFVNQKFRGCLGFEVITADPGFEPVDDPDAWKNEDLKMIRRSGAK